jgi:hypothetical protein
MYTLLELQAKTLAALKEIGHELNVLPEGDRRRRQSWIDAIAGVNPPLLQLLEVSPAASVRNFPRCRSRSEYRSRRSNQSLAASFTPNRQRSRSHRTKKLDPNSTEFKVLMYITWRSHPTKSDRDSSGAKTEALGSQEGDRVLAVARNRETGRGRVLPDQSIKLVNLTEADRLENEPRMSQSAIAQIAKTSPGVEVDRAQELIARSAENIPGVEPKKLKNFSFV